jgi:hypothetical protein
MKDIDIIDTCEHKTLVLGRCNIHTITDWLLFNAKRSAVQLFSWREQVYTQYVMHRWNRWHRWHMWHREGCWLQYTATKQYILPVSPVHDILFGSCILKSVALPVSPVHDISFGSCILKSVVLPVSPVSPVHDIFLGSCI